MLVLPPLVLLGALPLGYTFTVVSYFHLTGIDKRLATQCGAELIKAPCNAKIPSVSCDWIILTSASKVF